MRLGEPALLHASCRGGAASCEETAASAAAILGQLLVPLPLTPVPTPTPKPTPTPNPNQVPLPLPLPLTPAPTPNPTQVPLPLSASLPHPVLARLLCAVVACGAVGCLSGAERATPPLLGMLATQLAAVHAALAAAADHVLIDGSAVPLP